MTPTTNTQVRLKSRPDGIPQPEHFEVVAAPIPPLRDGQFLVRNDFLSVEPAMRGWVSAVANYSTPVGIGEVMRSFAAGEVIASRHPQFAEGDRLMGMFGWQAFCVAEPSAVTRKVTEADLPLSLSLGILGLNGITAYFGLLDVGRPRPGDTVVVSTAAGAVGSAVGQIAKIADCRAVGITGGAASLSSWDPWPQGPRIERHLLVKRAQMSGLLIFDYQPRYEEAVTRLADWVRQGKLRYLEEIQDGIEACPGAIARLYRGENLGKSLIRLRHGESR